MRRKECVKIATIVRNVQEIVENVWIKCIILEKRMNDKIIIVYTWFNIMFADICMHMLLK